MKWPGLLIDIALVIALLLCAMALVTSQHHARRAFIELERSKVQTRQIEQQWSELQLEQTAAAKHSFIDKTARTQLGMQAITPDRTQYIEMPGEMPAEVRP